MNYFGSGAFEEPEGGAAGMSQAPQHDSGGCSASAPFVPPPPPRRQRWRWQWWAWWAWWWVSSLNRVEAGLKGGNARCGLASHGLSHGPGSKSGLKQMVGRRRSTTADFAGVDGGGGVCPSAAGSHGGGEAGPFGSYPPWQPRRESARGGRRRRRQWWAAMAAAARPRHSA
jgi:hypothetical protein